MDKNFADRETEYSYAFDNIVVRDTPQQTPKQKPARPMSVVRCADCGAIFAVAAPDAPAEKTLLDSLSVSLGLEPQAQAPMLAPASAELVVEQPAPRRAST